MTFNCKIYNDSDSEFDNEYDVTTLFVDMKKVSSYHMATDRACTIIYVDGVAHEIIMNIKDFTQLKVSHTYYPKERFMLMFSQN